MVMYICGGLIVGYFIGECYAKETTIGRVLGVIAGASLIFTGFVCRTLGV